MRISFNEEAFSMLLIFFIPFMSLVENSKLFLAINTFAVLFRFFGFLKYDNTTLLLHKFIDFIIGLVWLIHHSIFFALFFYEDKGLDNS